MVPDLSLRGDMQHLTTEYLPVPRAIPGGEARFAFSVVQQ